MRNGQFSKLCPLKRGPVTAWPLPPAGSVRGVCGTRARITHVCKCGRVGRRVLIWLAAWTALNGAFTGASAPLPFCSGRSASYCYPTRGCGQTKCAPFSWAACGSRSGCGRRRLIPTSSGRDPQACGPPGAPALTQLALQTLCCGTSTLPRCYNHCHVRSGGTLRNPRTKPQFRAGA